jgi:hypothetical protein
MNRHIERTQITLNHQYYYPIYFSFRAAFIILEINGLPFA